MQTIGLLLDRAFIAIEFGAMFFGIVAALLDPKPEPEQPEEWDDDDEPDTDTVPADDDRGFPIDDEGSASNGQFSSE